MEKNERNRIILGLVIIVIMMILYILSGYSIDVTTLPVSITTSDNIICKTLNDGEVNCYEE